MNAAVDTESLTKKESSYKSPVFGFVEEPITETASLIQKLRSSDLLEVSKLLMNKKKIKGEINL